MPTVHALRLAAEIEQSGLKPLYALVGEDEALVRTAVGLLKAAVDRPELPGSVTRDLEELPEPAEVFDELRTTPFMGLEGLRLVIVRDGEEFVNANREALGRYLDSPPRTAVLALCCSGLDRRTSIGKAMARSGLIVACARLKWAEAKTWIRQEARRRGKTFTPQAVSALVEAVGPNVAALDSELEKLALYAGENGTIAERDVEDVVPASRTRSMFDLSEAIAGGDTPGALRLTERLLLRGRRPEEIVGFLGAQMRRLWRVKRMLSEGKTQTEIQKALGMRDFAVQKSARLVRRREDQWLAERMRLLAEADAEMKTTSLVAREQLVWVTALVARLCS